MNVIIEISRKDNITDVFTIHKVLVNNIDETIQLKINTDKYYDDSPVDEKVDDLLPIKVQIAKHFKTAIDTINFKTTLI